jgi:hypothetical protein
MFINGLNTFIILYLENYSDAHKTSFHLLIAFLRMLRTNFDAFAGLRTRLEIKSKFRVVCLSLVSFFFQKSTEAQNTVFVTNTFSIKYNIYNITNTRFWFHLRAGVVYRLQKIDYYAVH